ncbi:MAG: NRDE family protein [Sphingobacteriia bacterium]|jgi:hypothetical protein
MCTVTFIPTKSGFVITSNRDEHVNRGKAIAPIKIRSNDLEIVYPKDPDAGGTWIATNNNGDAIVLLNGAFEKHISKPPYAKSRGLILLEIFDLINFRDSIHDFHLDNIEPFTIVYFSDNHLFEFRWDGLNKYLKELNAHESHIWSSATLYNEEMTNKRKGWFDQWCLKNPTPNQEAAIDFHLNAGEGNTEVNVKMNRNNELFTVSISSIMIGNEFNDFVYIDLINNQTNKQQILLTKKINSILSSTN